MQASPLLSQFAGPQMQTDNEQKGSERRDVGGKVKKTKNKGGVREARLEICIEMELDEEKAKSSLFCSVNPLVCNLHENTLIHKGTDTYSMY